MHYRPDTAGYLNKLEEERIRKEKAANEPQTFFGKYVSSNFIKVTMLREVIALIGVLLILHPKDVLH